MVSFCQAPPLTLYLLIHVGAIWLVRSLYFYSGVVPALMDLGISALSVSAMAWAISRSGSVFLATWCFFLVQALFVAIPKRIGRRPGTGQDGHDSEARFQHAYRAAEAAVRRLSSNP